MQPDVIEGEIVESRAVATIPPVVGVQALANLSDAEFETNLRAIAKGQERIKKMQEALLVRGVDYANVPGVEKPSLGKPGAEKLCLAYGLAANVETRLTAGDGKSAPLLTYDSTCYLHLGSFSGPIVGVGHGTCNSWETKYRYRNASYVCPECGKELRHSRPPKNGWNCWAKLGGCGREFPDSDQRVKGQQIGQIENPDPHDLANTLMKMSEKRAHVDATLRATAASGIFTQDMEENVGTMPDEPPAAAVDTQKNAPRQSQGSSAAGRSGSTSAADLPAVTDADLDSLQAPATVQGWDAEAAQARVAEKRAARRAAADNAPTMPLAEFMRLKGEHGLQFGPEFNAAIERLFPGVPWAKLDDAQRFIVARDRGLLEGAE